LKILAIPTGIAVVFALPYAFDPARSTDISGLTRH
jgi:hypothetical protein